MAFKVYKNKITHHPSISLKNKDKKRWYNLSMSHSKPKDSYIKVKDPHPDAPENKHSYIRKYVRKDKRGVIEYQYNGYRFSQEDENEIKKYLKRRFKKR